MVYRMNSNAIGYSSSELKLIQERSIFSVEKKNAHIIIRKKIQTRNKEYDGKSKREIRYNV